MKEKSFSYRWAGFEIVVVGNFGFCWLLISSFLRSVSCWGFWLDYCFLNDGNSDTTWLGVLVARVWRKVEPTRVALISMLVAVIGVLLVVTNGDLSILSSGDNLLFATVLILLGVFCWVIYSAVGADFGHWSILRFLALSTLLGMVSVVILIIFATLIGWLKVPSLSTLNAILPELAYMVIPAGIVFTWNYGNRIAGPINVILFMNVVLVTTLLLMD